MRTGFFGQCPTNQAIRDAGDIAFSASECDQGFEIVLAKEVEASERTIVALDRVADLFDLANSIAGVVESGNEFEVSVVGGKKQFSKWREAVDCFLHGSVFCLGRPIPMFYRAVVLELGDVVDGCLNAQDYSLLIIHFDGGPTHVVFDAHSLDAVVKLIVGSDLGEGSSVEFLAQKHRHGFRLYCVNSRLDKRFVDGLEVFGSLEDDVGGILRLHDRPVI